MPYQHQILGTIIASVLNYDQLCTQMDESPAIDPKKSSYAPCDGRSIAGSSLEIKTNHGITHAPDLRGKFVRGLNVIYSVGQPLPFDPATNGDPQSNRVVGDFQGDAFRQHVHGYQRYVPRTETNISNDTDQRHTGAESNNTADNTGGANTGGGDETRPRNIAVYFYIKIN